MSDEQPRSSWKPLNNANSTFDLNRVLSDARQLAQERVEAERIAAGKPPIEAEIPDEEDVLYTDPAHAPEYDPTWEDNHYQQQALTAWIRGRRIDWWYAQLGGSTELNTARYTSNGDIQVSCISPDHPDKNPSAGLNVRKGLWHCMACEKGGSAIDLIGASHGLDTSSKLSGEDFTSVLNWVIDHYGLQFGQLRAGEEYGAPARGTEPQFQAGEGSNGWYVASLRADGPAPEPELPNITIPTLASPVTPPAEPSSNGSGPKENTAPQLSIVPISAADGGAENKNEDENEPEGINCYMPDWRTMFPPGTFIHEFMVETGDGKRPEIFRLVSAIVACGMACGNTYSWRGQERANLFVILVGDPSSGKSLTMSTVHKIIKRSKIHNSSTIVTGQPNSRAAFVNMFESPSAGGAPMNLLIVSDELSTLMRASNHLTNGYQSDLNSAWSGDSISNNTIARGYQNVEKPFVSLLAATPTGMLSTYLDDEAINSGFVSRLLAVLPNQKLPAVSRNNARRREDVDRLVELFNLMTDRPTAISKVPGFAGEYDLDYRPEAQDLSDALFNEVRDFENKYNTDEYSLLTRSRAARTSSIVIKFMICFTVNALEVEITKSVVEQTYEMWKWYLSTFEQTDTVVTSTQSREIQQQIIKKLTRVGDKGMTAGAFQYRGQLKRISDKELLIELKTLTEMNKIKFVGPKPILGKKGQPPKDRYYLFDTVPDWQKKEIAEQEARNNFKKIPEPTVQRTQFNQVRQINPPPK